MTVTPVQKLLITLRSVRPSRTGGSAFSTVMSSPCSNLLSKTLQTAFGSNDVWRRGRNPAAVPLNGSNGFSPRVRTERVSGGGVSGKFDPAQRSVRILRNQQITSDC